LSTFQPGRTKSGGRQRGVRNKLSHAFLSDLMEEWAEHGKETLRIARVERPVEFAKTIAGLCPREFELEISSTITQITDDELERFIEYCRAAAPGDNARLINGREEPQANREPISLLRAVSDPEKVS
jgi:hypothetical protein